MLWFLGLAIVMALGVLISMDFTARRASDEPRDEDAENLEELVQQDLEKVIGANNLPDTAITDQPTLISDTIPDDELPVTAEAVTGATQHNELLPPANTTALTAEVIAMDHTHEDLVLVWDDQQDHIPRVSLALNQRNPEITDVLLDNILVAHVPSDKNLSADAIALVPKSKAAQLGWTTA